MLTKTITVTLTLDEYMETLYALHYSYANLRRAIDSGEYTSSCRPDLDLASIRAAEQKVDAAWKEKE